MRHFLRALFFLFFGNMSMQIAAKAQSKPFVPLEFEYPESVLRTPKTFVYKNNTTGAVSYKDVAFQRKGNDVIVNWKSYDASMLKDSSIEINDKTLDHYMILNGQAVKAVVTADSVSQDGSRLGEKVQTFYFNLNESISLFASIHSFFSKDTLINWQGRSVPCIVIQSFNRQKLSNSLVPDKPKEISAMVYYYFGKDVGLLMYRTEIDKEKATWQLVEIKDLKN